MFVGAGAALVIAFAFGGATALADASTFDEVQTLQPSDGVTGDEFGQAVAVSGNTMVVGAPMDKDGTVYQYGAAFVYSQTSPGAWTLEQTLHPTVGDDHVDEFGSSVALDPDGVIVVGAPNEDTSVSSVSTETGAAWVFQPNGAGGYTQQELTGSIQAGAVFGESVAIQGTTIVVGAPGDSPNGSALDQYGAAYAYTQSAVGQSFSETTDITLASPENDDLFGHALAISGQTILVGAPGYDAGAGLVASYNEPSASDDWALADLTATQLSPPSGGGSFGTSLAVSTSVVESGGTFESGATTLVVGASGTSEGSTQDVGAAFVYGLPSDGDVGGLSDEAELQPTVSNTSPLYGSAVAIDGGTIGVEPGITGNQVYAYSEPGGGWSSSATGTEVEPTSPSAPLGDGAVAVSGNVFAFGAPSTVSTGFVYVFDQPATSVTVNLSPGSIAADGSSTSTATATVTDAAGDYASDEQVAFSASDPGVGIGAVTNNGDGTYTATITSDTTAGDVTITATDNTPNPAVSGNATLVQTSVVTTTVSGVSSTAANGSYGIGATLTVTVTFSGPVTVTGTPQLALNSGGVADYTSGSGSSTLTFGYTVAAGQAADPLDEASTTALTLNGGAIVDQDSNPADVTVPAPGAAGSLSANKSIVIDTTTATTVSSSSNPSVTGQSVTFTASVSPSDGGGTVAFYANGSSTPISGCGTDALALVAGRWQTMCTVAGLGVGTTSISATYSGDSTHSRNSGSLVGGQTVVAASTSTTLASSPNPASAGQLVTFTATVDVAAPGQGSPTGTVTFSDNGVQLGSSVLSTSGGVDTATFALSSLAAGTHPITATYSGSSSFDGSASATLGQAIEAAGTGVRLGHVSTRGIVATVPVSCEEPAGATCRFSVRLTAVELLHDGKLIAVTAVRKHKSGTKTKLVTLGGALIDISGGEDTDVHIRLDKTAKRLLSARHSFEATITATEAGKTIASEVFRVT